MSLNVDNKIIDYLFVDEQPIENAYVNGVLVFAGPEPPVNEQYVWKTAQEGTTGRYGYRFAFSVGDLTPKTWLGEFVGEMYVAQEAEEFQFRVSIDSDRDIGKDFFHLIAISEKGEIFYTDEADYIFSSTSSRCTWRWTTDMVVNEGDYNVSIYQREPPEVVVDFNLLPGVSSSGEHTGFRSLKVDDDTFGDVDPPHFLGDFLGKVYYRRVDADTQYTAFGTESVNARENWFRQIQILGGTNNLDITRFASEARFEVAENGTFWNWDDDLWDLIPGVNYTLRVRGRNPLLFKFTYLITPARTENDGSSPGSDEGVIIGIDRNQPPYVNIPPERIVPQYLKAQEINLFFSFESGVQDCAIGIGSTENVPQSYWYAYELLDYNYEDRVDNYLYNNIGDDPVIKSNIWLRRNNTLPWIQDVQTRLNIYADSNTVSTKQQEQVGHRRYAYKFTPERVGMSFGYRKSLTPFGQLTVPEYRNREIIGLYINEFYNTFVLVMKRNDLLNTAVRELFIPEINYRIKMADMTFDNTTLDDRTIWTSKVVPELEEGEEYAVWLWD